MTTPRLRRLEEEIISLRSEMSALRENMNARMDRIFFSMRVLAGGVIASMVATILARLL